MIAIAICALFMQSGATQPPPVRNLVPLPIFPLVTATLEPDLQERAQVALESGIVLNLERLSKDLPDFDVKRLADKVILDACFEERLQPPTKTSLWSQAELRALARRLDLRFASQIVVDRVTFGSVGVGAVGGSLQCTVTCRFWLADVQSPKPPPREFMPVTSKQVMSNDEVIAMMGEGSNPRIKLLESAVTAAVDSSLDKYFATLVRKRR